MRSRSIAIALPVGITRADLEAACGRTDGRRRRRHGDYVYRLAGDDTLVVTTNIGSSRSPTPARWSARIDDRGPNLVLSGEFRISVAMARFWLALTIFIAAMFVICLLTRTVPGAVIFGVATPIFVWISYAQLNRRTRTRYEQVFGDALVAGVRSVLQEYADRRAAS